MSRNEESNQELPFNREQPQNCYARPGFGMKMAVMIFCKPFLGASNE